MKQSHQKREKSNTNFYANCMRSHNTCHAEHKDDVACDVLENFFLFFLA